MFVCVHVRVHQPIQSDKPWWDRNKGSTSRVLLASLHVGMPPAHPTTLLPSASTRYTGKVGAEYPIWDESWELNCSFGRQDQGFTSFKWCQTPGLACGADVFLFAPVILMCFYNQCPFQFSECHYESSHVALTWILLSKQNKYTLKWYLLLLA